MDIKIRNYNSDTDYEAVKALYESTETYGGQYDDARDAKDRLEILIHQKPDAILVAEDGSKILGTVTLFEDGRSAWLYRFAVLTQYEKDVTRLLYEKASSILKQKGHTQVLVYAPAGYINFEQRYAALGFNKGADYTAYWQDLK